jgi:hypothetical protein
MGNGATPKSELKSRNPRPFLLYVVFLETYW